MHNMASLLLSAALTLSLLLTSAYAQNNPAGSYDITAEKGWDNFVKEAAKGTGGTPINMDEFVTRVNNNINKGGDEGADPDLMAELKSLDDRKGLDTVPSAATLNSSNSDAEIQPSTAAMDDLATAKMIASANGGSLAPEKADSNGAFSAKAVGVVCGLLPVFAACFVL